MAESQITNSNQTIQIYLNKITTQRTLSVYRNLQGMARNLCDLTVASSQYDTLLCSGTLVSAMRHVSELLVPGFGRLVLL